RSPSPGAGIQARDAGEEAAGPERRKCDAREEGRRPEGGGGALRPQLGEVLGRGPREAGGLHGEAVCANRGAVVRLEPGKPEGRRNGGRVEKARSDPPRQADGRADPPSRG